MLPTQRIRFSAERVHIRFFVLGNPDLDGALRKRDEKQMHDVAEIQARLARFAQNLFVEPRVEPDGRGMLGHLFKLYSKYHTNAIQFVSMTRNPKHSQRLTTPISLPGARVVRGRGRGKTIGIPTLNLELAAVPEALKPGIYACWVWIGSEKFMGALHFGERPVFKDSVTLEVHVIDEILQEIPERIDLEIVGWIRDIEDFGSVNLLVKKIKEDILAARAMLHPA